MKRLNQSNINDPAHFNERFTGCLGVHDMARFELLAKYFKGGSYLDIGAFDSVMPMLLAERFLGAEINVLDFADKIMEFLTPRFPKVKFITYDIRSGGKYHLPFNDKSLDYVVAGEVIEHVEDPKAFTEELLRVVKPGGYVAISTPHKEIERNDRIGGPFHLWSYDEEDMKTFFKEPEIKLHLEGRFNTMLVWQKK